MLSGVMKMGVLLIFYNAVSRLSKRACEISESFGKECTLDLISHKQDTAQIEIEPEKDFAELIPMKGNRFLYLDNLHTIEIEANGLQIYMSNDV